MLSRTYKKANPKEDGSHICPQIRILFGQFQFYLAKLSPTRTPDAFLLRSNELSGDKLQDLHLKSQEFFV